MAARGRRPVHDARRRAPDGAARAAGLRRPRRVGGHRRRHRRRRSPAAPARAGRRGRASGAQEPAAACTTHATHARLPDPVLHQRRARRAGARPQGRSRSNGSTSTPPTARPSSTLTGQDLVPVLQTDQNEVVVDSMRIVALAREAPARPAAVARRAPARRAEVDVFVEWFNRVWKVPPNAIEAELAPAREPDEHRIARLERGAARVAALFEACSTAATTSWATLRRRRHLRLPVPQVRRPRAAIRRRRAVPPGPGRAPADRGRLPRVEAWVHRVDARPRRLRLIHCAR